MILKGGWVFVHCPKTAGRSIVKALGGNTEGIAPHTPLWRIHKGDRYAFGFVRNPWARQVSFYRYLCQHKFRISPGQTFSRKRTREMGFKRWLLEDRFLMGEDDSVTPIQRRSQMYWLEGCDYIGRYEHLEDDFAEACRGAGIAIPRLPHINSSRGGDWRAEHDEQTVAFIARHFAPEIERFGYKPPCV